MTGGFHVERWAVWANLEGFQLRQDAARWDDFFVMYAVGRLTVFGRFSAFRARRLLLSIWARWLLLVVTRRLFLVGTRRLRRFLDTSAGRMLLLVTRRFLLLRLRWRLRWFVVGWTSWLEAPGAVFSSHWIRCFRDQYALPGIQAASACAHADADDFVYGVSQHFEDLEFYENFTIRNEQREIWKWWRDESATQKFAAIIFDKLNKLFGYSSLLLRWPNASNSAHFSMFLKINFCVHMTRARTFNLPSLFCRKI